MKLQHELTELLVDRAMSGVDIVAWWNERARCCRCSWYDKQMSACTNDEHEMGGREVWNPADHGCPHFSDD